MEASGRIVEKRKEREKEKYYDVAHPPSVTEEPRIMFEKGKERETALKKWEVYQKTIDAENGVTKRQGMDRELGRICRARNQFIPLHQQQDVYTSLRLVSYANGLKWEDPDKPKYLFEALHLDPESSMAMYQIANWYHHHEHNSYWAIHFYYKALCRQKNHCRAYLGIARVMFHLRHYDAAIRCYRHAIFLARDPALSLDVQRKADFIPGLLRELDRAVKWHMVTERQQRRGVIVAKHALVTALLGDAHLFPTIRLLPPPPSFSAVPGLIPTPTIMLPTTTTAIQGSANA